VCGNTFWHRISSSGPGGWSNNLCGRARTSAIGSFFIQLLVVEDKSIELVGTTVEVCQILVFGEVLLLSQPGQGFLVNLATFENSFSNIFKPVFFVLNPRLQVIISISTGAASLRRFLRLFDRK